MFKLVHRLVRGFKNWVIRFKYRRGLLTKEDIMRQLLPLREQQLLKLPTEEREELQLFFNRLEDTNTYRDVGSMWNMVFQATEKLQQISQRYGKKYGLEDRPEFAKISYITSVGDGVGYRPAAARIWKFFVNPYAVYTFYYENHWAFKTAVRVWCLELLNQGWDYVHAAKVRPARVAAVADIVENVLDFASLYNGVMRNLFVFGDALVRRHEDVFGNFLGFDLWVLDRVQPVYDRYHQTLLGWDYTTGYVTVFYPKEEVFQTSFPSMQFPQIGSAPIAPLVVDLEADMCASSLNSTMMYKAGMVSFLIALEDPSADNRVTLAEVEKYKRTLQQEIHRDFSGVKAGQTMLVSNFVKAVHKLTQLGEFEGNFMKFRLEVAKSICTTLLLPLSRLNLPLLSNAQYASASMEDKVGEYFNIAAQAHAKQGLQFMTRLLESIDIDDIQLAPRPRPNSVTLNGPRASRIAAEVGAILNKNEHRVMYGVQPWPAWDESGWELPDNSLNRDPKSNPIETQKSRPDQVSFQSFKSFHTREDQESLRTPIHLLNEHYGPGISNDDGYALSPDALDEEGNSPIDYNPTDGCSPQGGPGMNLH